MSAINPSSWSIKAKLYGGFGFMLAISVGLAAFGTIEFQAVDAKIDLMNRRSQNATRVMDIDKSLESMCRGILRYAYDHDEASLNLFNETAVKVIAALRAVEKETLAGERQKTYLSIESEIPALQKQGNDLAEMVKQGIEAKAQLSKMSDLFTALVKSLTDEVAKEADPSLSLMNEKLNSILLNVRVVNMRSQVNFDKDGVKLMQQVAAAVLMQLEALDDAARSKAVHDLVEEVKPALANYIKNGIAVIDNLIKERDLYRDGIAPTIIRLQGIIGTTKTEILEQFGSAQSSAEQVISMSASYQQYGGGLAILFAGLLALFTARGIARPLAGLTSGMKELANGRLDVVLPGLGRGDEIGDIAEAVEDFKVKAAEKARSEADIALRRQVEEAEAQARISAEREEIAAEQVVVMKQLGAALTKLSAKDLSYRMTEDMPEAYSRLQSDFNTAIEQLEDALKSVSATSDGVRSGTSEIATAADDLSRRTEQQASSLEETAAALGEITATVRKTAEGAKQAREVVAIAATDAAKSGDVVQQAVTAMGKIEKSSQEISQIIGVIDEIAFQTNLLDLNEPGRRRRRACGRDGQIIGADCYASGADQFRRERNRRERPRAGNRLAAGQHGGQPDGSDDPAERRDGRRSNGGKPIAGKGKRTAHTANRPVPNWPGVHRSTEIGTQERRASRVQHG